MKRNLRSLLVCMLALLLLPSMIACQTPDVPGPGTGTGTGTGEQPTGTEAPTDTQAPPTNCQHTYVESIEVPAKALADGVKKFTCSACAHSYTEAIPATKEIKILAIGNSFSTDATEYLWNIMSDGGVEKVTIGNLYIGGCTLATHSSNLRNQAASYKYYKNTAGEWKLTEGATIQAALAEEEWDIITVQQASGNSGVATTYAPLDYMLTELAKLEPNAAIFWHMTWAYQQNSTHSDFGIYSKDQVTMYNAILSAVDTKIKPDNRISGVIPVGTAIQNLRNSYLGDTITRDGYHLSYSHGRYTAALTWFAYFTGGSVDAVDWVPGEHSAALTEDLPLIREAITKALAKPYEITACTTVDPSPAPDITGMTDADRIALLGYNINDYVLLDWSPEIAAFYNSKNSWDILNAANSPSVSYLINYIGSRHLYKDDLPIGTLILVDEGYVYRPEGWFVDGQATGTSRPGNVTDSIVEVTEAWWGTHVAKGFNLSTDPVKTMTEEDATHLRIYVPKNAAPTPKPEPEPDPKPEPEPEPEPTPMTDAEYLASLGYDINNYVILDWTPEVAAFYNCKTSYAVLNSTNSTAGNLINFIASRHLTKADLPNGTLILIDEGYNYRPEGWTAENVLSSARATATTEKITVVDDAWWGDWTIRGFNLGASPAKVMAAEDATHLRIYVPKPADPEPANPDAALFAANGLDINNYEVLDWDPEVGAFYNSKNSWEVLNSTNSTAGNLVNFIASKHLTKADLPNGTVIILDEGFNYRAEGWFVEGQKTGTARPGAVTTPFAVVDDAWWGTHVIKAFNLGTPASDKVMAEEDAAHLRIYVPKAA